MKLIFQYDDGHMMDWWFDAFGPYWGIFMTLWMILYFGTSIVIAYYIHKDAVRLGIQNSEVWLILGLIFNIIGLILYLLVRGNYNTSNPRKESKDESR